MSSESNAPKSFLKLDEIWRAGMEGTMRAVKGDAMATQGVAASPVVLTRRELERKVVGEAIQDSVIDAAKQEDATKQMLEKVRWRRPRPCFKPCLRRHPRIAARARPAAARV